MTRSSLIKELAKTYGLSLKQAEQCITRVLTEMTAALARGERIEVRGWGALTVRQRKARTALNPKNQTPVQVEAKGIPFFRASQVLLDDLQKRSILK